MSKIICIDAGHGGADPGAAGNGLQEKKITLRVSQLCDEYMRSHYPELKPILARAIDKTVGLSERVQFSNNAGAHLFISIHVNAHETNTATGFESFIYTASKKSPGVQFIMHPRLSRVFSAKNIRDRGQKTANYYVVKNTNAPAILLELGFISNPTDAKLLSDDKFLQSCAKQIVNGAAAYFGFPERLC
jgi:N-acetylmuramoyl-L-alanine amidase